MKLLTSFWIAVALVLNAQRVSAWTSAAPCPTPPAAKPNYGDCPDPRILYVWNPDNTQRWAYVPANETQFPHGWSPDIATIESFICSRLLSPCHADNVAVALCQGAFDFFSGLTGDWAVAAWNTALGLGWNGEMGSCVSGAYATTTTVTVVAGPGPPPPPPPQTTVQESLTITTATIETTSTLTATEITGNSPTKTPWTTLTITLTLPSSTITDSQMQGTLTSTQTETLTAITSVTTGISGGHGVTAIPGSGGGGGGGGGGSPFDSSASSRVPYDVRIWVMLVVLLLSCIFWL